MQIAEMTPEQARILSAKQGRDRAFQEYQESRRPKVEQIPNLRQNFSAAATAVTRQGLNSVADCDSNFVRVQEKFVSLRQPMTIENIVHVLSDGSLQGLAPNQHADELRREKEQQDRKALIDEIVEDYSFDEHARSVYRTKLEKSDVTLEALRQQVSAIKERRRLYELSPAQIRAENSAKRDQAQPETPKPIRVAAGIRALNMQYPVMPAETLIGGREIVLDSKYIRRCSGDELKNLIRLYGDKQIVERLRGIS